jgi:hypothetical protein
MLDNIRIYVDNQIITITNIINEYFADKVSKVKAIIFENIC